jgi:hypothetical protein
MRRALLVGALIAAGCGGEESPPVAATSSSSGTGGSGGGVPTDAGAVLPCPPGELQVGDACVAPGVPADGCAVGFVHEDMACVAVLPAQPCGPGTYALPGETTCHGVGSVPQGKWGDIVTASDTQFVDATFVGTSNGSQAAPWTTIQQGVAAASGTATVAVAAGVYAGTVFVDKPITLWGAGAGFVAIGGGGGPAVQVLGAAAQVRGVSLTGQTGVAIYDTAGAVVREVHVHDCTGNGIVVAGAEATVDASLVENVVEAGIAAPDASVTVTGSVVRDVAPNAMAEWGAGILAWSSLASKKSVVVRGSLVERTSSYGIVTQDSLDTLVEDTLVRDVEVMPSNGDNGIGINQWWVGGGERASLVVRGTVVERSHTNGVVAWGGDITIERVTVRDVSAPDTADQWGAGIGIMVDDFADGVAAVGVVRESTVDDGHRVGVEIWGSEAELERVLVRRPRPKSNGEHGFGVLASSQLVSGLPSALTWHGGRIEDANQGGLTIMGSSGTIDSVAVLRTEPNGSGALGVGIAVITSYITGTTASAEMTRVVVDGAHGGGIVVGGGDLVLADALVRNIEKQPNVDDFGDGIAAAATIVWVPGHIPTTLELTRATIESVPRAGVSCFGADIVMRGTLLDCNEIDLDGEVIEDHDFTFDDAGGNHCGCGDERRDCKVLTTNLAPPLSL